MLLFLIRSWLCYAFGYKDSKVVVAQALPAQVVIGGKGDPLTGISHAQSIRTFARQTYQIRLGLGLSLTP
jgi:hypothetical protein